jgi:hypothetical protein
LEIGDFESLTIDKKDIHQDKKAAVIEVLLIHFTALIFQTIIAISSS